MPAFISLFAARCRALLSSIRPVRLAPRGRAWRLGLASGALAALATACGGGGGSVAGVGSGGTGAYTAGAISGFGSIFVNGVEFDDRSAQLQDDEGQPVARGGNALRLGMTVAIDSPTVSTTTATPQAVASTIQIGTELVGPVSAVDVTARRVTVLGQTVQVTATTVLDERLVGAGGLASLAGKVVVVYGLPGAGSGGPVATRIEPAAEGLSVYKLRGLISEINRPAATVRIDGATLVAQGGVALPAAWNPGSLVRVRLRTTPDALGRWVIASVDSDEAPGSSRNGRDARLDGLVTGVTDARNFQLNGVPVNLGELSADGRVQLGARIEVRGRFVAGVLQATDIDVKDEAQDSEREFDVRGVVSALDRASQTLTVQGQVMAYGTARFDDGGPADLAVGGQVEVKARLAANGTRLVATRVKLAD
ncbi:MAG: DUF5666 domain-containing protein [Pseudomonadota bacterium]